MVDLLQVSAQNFFEVVKIERALYLGSSIVLARIYHVCSEGRICFYSRPSLIRKVWDQWVAELVKCSDY